MLLAILLISLINFLLFLKPLRVLLEGRERDWTRRKLLADLDRMHKESFAERGMNALVFAKRLFDNLAGESGSTIRYVLRLIVIGWIIGSLLSLINLVKIAVDISQVLRMLQSVNWWKSNIFPTILTGALFFPIDLAVANKITLWGIRGGAKRSIPALLVTLPIAYIMWGVATGVATYLTLEFMTNGTYVPGLFWNRIWTALSDPFSRSGFGLNTHYLSFGWLAASSALSILTAFSAFLITAITARFSAKLKLLIALPYFSMLRVLNWFKRRKINIPLGAVFYSLLAFQLILYLVVMNSKQ